MEDSLRRYLGKQLRRLFYRSPIRREAFKRFPLKCVECQEAFPKNELDVDHVDPVVPVDRHVASLEYFMRMFCLDGRGEVDMNNLVLLCKGCHKAKSRAEMGERARNKTGPYSEAAKARRLSKKKKRKSRA